MDIYEVKPVGDGPRAWLVTATGQDGEVLDAEFFGTWSKQRAEEYAAWKNSGGGKDWPPDPLVEWKDEGK